MDHKELCTMSIIKRNVRKISLAFIAGGLVVGGAFAAAPPGGQGWQEWTYYNASGVAIGGTLHDCDGGTYRWGASTGYADVAITSGPCP
jgi:hypothetical protein